MPKELADAFALPTAEARGAEYIRRLKRDLGLTPEQAAGLVGNLLYESNGFKSLQEGSPTVPGSRGGYGVAQWTGPRRKAFEAWCGARALAPSTDAANYGFLCEELRTTYKHTLDRLQQTTDTPSSTWLVGQTYETPEGTTPTHLPGYSDRLIYAQRSLTAYLSGAVIPPPIVPPPVPVPLPDPDDTITPKQAMLDYLIRAVQVLLDLPDDGICGEHTIAAIQKAQSE